MYAARMDANLQRFSATVPKVDPSFQLDVCTPGSDCLTPVKFVGQAEPPVYLFVASDGELSNRPVNHYYDRFVKPNLPPNLLDTPLVNQPLGSHPSGSKSSGNQPSASQQEIPTDKETTPKTETSSDLLKPEPDFLTKELFTDFEQANPQSNPQSNQSHQGNHSDQSVLDLLKETTDPLLGSNPEPTEEDLLVFPSPQPPEPKTYLPYFSEVLYATEACSTKLIGRIVYLTVELAGFSDLPRIYPFGETIMTCSPKTVTLQWKSDSSTGTCSGQLYCLEGKPVIEINSVTNKDQSISFEDIDLPCIFQGEFLL